MTLFVHTIGGLAQLVILLQIKRFLLYETDLKILVFKMHKSWSKYAMHLITQFWNTKYQFLNINVKYWQACTKQYQFLTCLYLFYRCSCESSIRHARSGVWGQYGSREWRHSRQQERCPVYFPRNHKPNGSPWGPTPVFDASRYREWENQMGSSLKRATPNFEKESTTIQDCLQVSRIIIGFFF